jgi:predicted TIM-barrel fold metal-dependent hydrolase
MSLRPSDYFLRQCFISVDVEENLAGDVIRRVGDENLVISTDYPHADSHWPNAIDHFMTVDMPSASRRKILWDNCARLYGVDEKKSSLDGRGRDEPGAARPQSHSE